MTGVEEGDSARGRRLEEGEVGRTEDGWDEHDEGKT